MFGKIFDCGDLYLSQTDYQPGAQNIRLTLSSGNGVQAACTSDGWTVIQSRGQFGNPVDYFLRNWTQYVEGFGIPGKRWKSFKCSSNNVLNIPLHIEGEEYWMGLDNMYHLTQLGAYSLRLKLEDLDGVVEEINYEKFKLSDQVNIR